MDLGGGYADELAEPERRQVARSDHAADFALAARPARGKVTDPVDGGIGHWSPFRLNVCNSSFRAFVRLEVLCQWAQCLQR